MSIYRRLGVYLTNEKKLRQTLIDIHNFKKIKILSVESLDGDMVLILEWSEFEPVKLKKKKYPPAYNKQFFLLKGLKL